MPVLDPSTLLARNAVAAVFALNGFAFASWVSRIPDARAALDLSVGDPRHAAARVSVVSTIGYTAFLAGPPVLGLLGDRVGVLNALLLVAVLLVPSALAVPSARPSQTPVHHP